MAANLSDIVPGSVAHAFFTLADKLGWLIRDTEQTQRALENAIALNASGAVRAQVADELAIVSKERQDTELAIRDAANFLEEVAQNLGFENAAEAVRQFKSLHPDDED